VKKVLVAEIGSTTTVVNAFGDLNTENPKLLGQGFSPTTVQEGDVGIGLRKAVAELEKLIGPVGLLGEIPFYATSSAAGGLKMTVHGLVPDMTARAAREAALGAGAVVRYQTAGELMVEDWEEILRIRPNIMLLAGGVDHGDRRIVLENAKKLATWFSQVPWRIPIIYAGNTAASASVQKTLAPANLDVRVVPNVYPEIDQLNIEPTRKAIQEVFEQHIIEAPGMQGIREIVNARILPTPGAVMQAAHMIYKEVGDVLVFDVGGATTDVHSVTLGAEENQKLALGPEPLAKRTVEGDLGVFVNAEILVELMGKDKIVEHHGQDWFSYLKPVPETPKEMALSAELAAAAVKIALLRHSGRYRYYYGTSGRVTRVDGRDLTRIRWIVGTGGALTRLHSGLEMMRESILQPGDALLPEQGVAFLLDSDYIMASLGVLATSFPQGAWQLLRQSLGVEN
jgi:uncharacterized protein (TIGR01319 family)